MAQLPQPLFRQLARSLAAMNNCRKNGNLDWIDKHERNIEELVYQFMPRGSGVDNGTKFNFEKSTPEKLVFDFGYHHMDEHGFYDGWTEHTLTVRPSLQFGVDLKISGRNRNEIKDYLHDLFHHAISIQVFQSDNLDWRKVESD
jgi:hypothetical protein